MAPRSVYVHIPFCRHRCGYCNFTLVAGRDYLIEPYLTALEIELDSIQGPWPVDTIYLGGGTPTRLPAAALDRVLELLQAKFEIASDGEFTIEANPDDLPGPTAKVVANSSINRVSLGVQSFDAKKLSSLDRPHSIRQIWQALSTLPDLVERVSVDLIFAAPHDSLAIWERELRAVVDCGAEHVSTYELTYEKGTQFWNQVRHGKMTPVDSDRSADYYELAIQYLTGTGLEHYEVSSFARPGGRSRHNQVYWQGDDFFAFGPGASGLVDNVRYTNCRSVSRYLKRVLAGESPLEEQQVLTDRQRAQERVVFGLRMIEGVDLEWLQSETGLSLTDVVDSRTLDRLIEQEAVELRGGRMKLTHRGLLLGDIVCRELLDPL